MSNKTVGRIALYAAIIIALPTAYNINKGALRLAEMPARMDDFELSISNQVSQVRTADKEDIATQIRPLVAAVQAVNDKYDVVVTRVAKVEAAISFPKTDLLNHGTKPDSN